MKTPTTADFFALGRLFTMLNVKDDVREIAKNKSNGNKSDSFDIGYDLIMTIMGKAVQKNVEKEIYIFLANACEMDAEELQNPSVFLNAIKSIKDSEEWRTIFSQAAELIIMK